MRPLRGHLDSIGAIDVTTKQTVCSCPAALLLGSDPGTWTRADAGHAAARSACSPLAARRSSRPFPAVQLVNLRDPIPKDTR